MEKTLKMTMTPPEGEHDYTCPDCKGDNLRFDGSCYWNAGEQWWEIDEVSNNTAYCVTCGWVVPVKTTVDKNEAEW